jgi:hypothetical protein
MTVVVDQDRLPAFQIIFCRRYPESLQTPVFQHPLLRHPRLNIISLIRPDDLRGWMTMI